MLFWIPGVYMYKTCAYAVIFFDNSMASKFFMKFEFVIFSFERFMDFGMMYVYKFGARFGFPFVLWFLQNSRCIIYGSNKEQLGYIEHHLNRYSDLIQLQMSNTQQQPETKESNKRTIQKSRTIAPKRPPTNPKSRPAVTPRNAKPTVLTRSATRAQTPKK